MAALGNVICEMAKNDARRGGALAAQRDRKYRPNAAIHPENTQVRMPGIIPPDAMAYYGRTKLTLGLGGRHAVTNQRERQHPSP